VYCDHADEKDIKALFERIDKENNGQLDILINNAYAAVNKNSGKMFWEMDVSMWDEVNNVGLRNHYFCTVYAARLMVPRRQGLIVMISSPGGMRYLFNIPYGVGKTACDRLAADTAVELQKHNITSVSLWPGAVKTELITHNVIEKPLDGKASAAEETVRRMFENGESTEFSGMCLRALAADPERLKKNWPRLDHRRSGVRVWTERYRRSCDFIGSNGQRPARHVRSHVASRCRAQLCARARLDACRYDVQVLMCLVCSMNYTF